MNAQESRRTVHPEYVTLTVLERNPRRLRAIAIWILALLVATTGAVALQPSAAQRADAADLSTFQPGNIISNEVFFDASALSLRDVETFVQRMRPTCASGYTCLPWYAEVTPNRAADTYCNGYTGERDSAAAIVWKVAQSCGINPQVLLVTLQKEQGLVTSNAPSASAYRIAMGQGCPDTSACDTRYYGFFNQVYGAARQFKIYTENRYFTYYAPGRTWNLRYHPNASCGSSPVYIANQATANLYYYTPYQPNAAALRAGYGTGDDCSAYGNRNFFSYFTDWFGSTQKSSPKILRAAGSDAVYLVNDGVKYHIRTYDDLLSFQSRLGDVTQVAASYAALFPTGGSISRYVHDPRTGTLYLLEADGSRHRLVSEEQIRSLGWEFGSYVNLSGAIIDRFTLGAEVNSFVRVANGTEVFRLEGSTLRYVPSMEVWRATSATGIYAANVNAEIAARWSEGPTLLPPRAMVRESGTADVLLTGESAELLHVRNLRTAADWGVTASYVVPAGSIRGWSRTPGWLAPVISCGSTVLVATGGGGTRVTGTTTSLAPLGVGNSLCPVLETRASSAAPIFVTTPDNGRAYEIKGGKLDFIATYEDLVARNGSRPLQVLPWSRESADAKGYLTPTLAGGSLVQFTGSGEVYVVRDGRLLYVPTYQQLLDLSNGRPVVRQVEDRHRAAYAFGPALLLNGQFIQFAGAGEVYVVDSSQLRHVTTYARLMSLTGGRQPSIIVLPVSQRGDYRYGADY